MKTLFLEEDPSAGGEGTFVTAAFLNAINNPVFDGADEDGHYQNPIVTVPQRSVSASGDLLATNCIVFVDATAGDVNVNVPAGGSYYVVKKIDASANLVSIIPPEGKTIDGEANLQLSVKNEKCTLVVDADGNWQTI